MAKLRGNIYKLEIEKLSKVAPLVSADRQV